MRHHRPRIVTGTENRTNPRKGRVDLCWYPPGTFIRPLRSYAQVRQFLLSVWNVGGKLPPGLAAMASAVLPFGLIIPCMAATWYTGPIAKVTGDIGFEVGLALSVLFYLPLRSIERKVFGR